jgi:hypothetical protein
MVVLTPCTCLKSCVSVYGFCENKDIAHQFSKEKEMAGKHWFKLFINGHLELASSSFFLYKPVVGTCTFLAVVYLAR